MNQKSKTVLFDKRYILNKVLGEGGMGIVYRARDRLTQKDVALKQVFAPIHSIISMSHSETYGNELTLAREFQTLASLRHPNIISVLDYGFHQEENGNKLPYFTMTLLHSAKHIVEASIGLGHEGKLHLLVQVLQALEYLHQRGIIHHDLKPANILVDNEQVKLLDFGLAISPGESLGARGTLPYMAPEVLRDQQVSMLADLYAVGVIAYEMFAGYHPFDVNDIQALLRGILTETPDMTPFMYSDFPDALKENLADFNLASTVIVDNDEIAILQEHVQSLSKDSVSQSGQAPDKPLGQIVHRLLAKEPAERYQSATEVLTALYALLNEPITLETPEIRDSFLQAAKFVGRDEEQTILEDALRNALLNQKGSAWLVGGESGAGKTRLLNEVRVFAMVHGALVITGQGVKEGGYPYQIWRDAIRRLCINVEVTDLEASVLKAVVPDIDYLLSRPITDAPPLQNKENQVRLISTLKAVIERYPEPILLLLEDLHWASESLAVLHSIVDVCQVRPLVIIGSFRDDEAPDIPKEFPSMQLLRLGRLDKSEITLLSQAILGNLGRHPAIIDLLHRETEGNVFFVIETIRELAEQAGKLSNINTIELPAIVFPNGIKDIVQRRLQNIKDVDLEILRIAAVVGRELDLHLMTDAIRQSYGFSASYIDRWLVSCATESLIEIDGGESWRFAHDKIRQEILQQIPQDKRKQLHEQVAVLLEARSDANAVSAAILAFHWRMAEHLAKEAHYTSLAGRKAAEQGLSEASTLLERCVELYDHLGLDDLDWHLQNLFALSQSYSSQGHIAKALDAVEKALNLIDTHNLNSWMVRALYIRGTITLRQGNLEDARQDLSAALALLGDRERSELKSQILMWLGAASTMMESFDDSNRYLEQALSIAKERESLKRVLASILNTLAENRRSQGHFEEAIGYYKQSIETYSNIGHVYAQIGVPINLGNTYLAMGNLDDAEITFYGVMEKSLAQRNMMLTIASLAGVGGVLAKRGQLTEGLELLGLVMRHPQCSAEIRLFINNVVIKDIQTALDEEAYEATFNKIKIEDVTRIASRLVSTFWAKNLRAT